MTNLTNVITIMNGWILIKIILINLQKQLSVHLTNTTFIRDLSF